ncbi:hypothetical protein DN752_02700 [Echinicola strongylocentroti]|uniref:Uncharacterized protein YyaB-like PH domain-containing protein n=1 Tax=Echinicola strongylocentroti TaxID=1795355 RepID=A0A2Z4IF83_9BACT|nr:PH domain-containing protein [Echinicola strongylocentroti]AWW29138.1 hypothetical protein DN752_02700 [Echinicola strongylocentroti]
MKIHKANRSGYIRYLLIAFIILPVMMIVMDRATFMERPTMILPMLAPLILVGWAYLDTSYRLENGWLIYRSGFLRGKVDVSVIKEIQPGKTLWVGIKPALARKGLIVKYNTYDELYIAPVDNDEMVTDLLGINPTIKVVADQ